MDKCLSWPSSIVPNTANATETILKVNVKVKEKQSRNRPGVAQRVPAGLGSQIS
jgi:hypothetical protein